MQHFENIVVTGYGVKAPQSVTKDQFKHVLEQGICTQQRIPGLGPNGSDIVCGIIEEEFDEIGGKSYKRYPRFAKLAIAASHDAVEMAGLKPEIGHRRIAILMGSSVGGLIDLMKVAEPINNDQFRDFPLHGVGLTHTHSISSAVAAHHGITGPAFTLSSGCTSSTDAILLGKLLLESGQADAVIVGGADAPVSRATVFGFLKLRALSKQLDVDKAGAPFSEASDGFVIAEGAGALVMEREGDALERGASIYGVINRVVSNNDAVSIFGADTSGERMLESLRAALGGTVPTYVNSQALGIKENDRVDSFVHQALFDVPVPITTIKSTIGHTFGSTGALQTIAALLSFEYGMIPPTIKTDGLGFGELPIVYRTQYCEVENVAVITHGYGGNNTCLLVSKYHPAAMPSPQMIGS